MIIGERDGDTEIGNGLIYGGKRVAWRKSRSLDDCAAGRDVDENN